MAAIVFRIDRAIQISSGRRVVEHVAVLCAARAALLIEICRSVEVEELTLILIRHRIQGQ